MITHPLLVLAVLGANVAASEWLARHTWLRHLGSALLVIVLTAVLANAGLIPTYSDEVPLYVGIFDDLAPLAIFLLLLRVQLRSVLSAGAPMLALFFLGAAGTVAGVLAAMWIVGGSEAFGDLYYALGGMFVGTYTGGSINFNAIALQYGVVKHGALYAGAAAVDSAMTTVWMAATVLLPRWIGGRRGTIVADDEDVRAAATSAASATETVRPFDLALLLAIGAAAVRVSDLVAAWSARAVGVEVPSILILTTLALVLAQLPVVQRLKGAMLCGWLIVMLFLAVIGALCDLSALQRLGQLGPSLILFVTTVVLIHGAITFGAGALLRVDPAMTAVASQANIGGGTSALALARSLGRSDLMLPAILIGSVGNAVGTYLGFLVAIALR